MHVPPQIQWWRKNGMINQIMPRLFPSKSVAITRWLRGVGSIYKCSTILPNRFNTTWQYKNRPSSCHTTKAIIRKTPYHLAEKMHFSFIAIAIALTASMPVNAQACDGSTPCLTDSDCAIQCPGQFCDVSIVLQTRPVTHRVIRSPLFACHNRSAALAVSSNHRRSNWWSSTKVR
jgi:hypothetical protein